jgi:ornithine cyclodeaminase/alanine dehydrogenase-like protein (mu-crystallin family)
VKGAILDGFGVAGFRLVTDGTHTTETNSAHLYVVDCMTGEPRGLVSETWLHRVRTASTGLLACKTLAPKTADWLALIGTGRIAEEFVRSVQHALPHIKIILASRSAERAVATAERWQALTPNHLEARTISDALARADIVVTLSDADEVLFSSSDTTRSALICAMGGGYEFDRDILDASTIFVVDEMDFVCAAGTASRWIKTGQLSRAHLTQRLDATIGDVLSGRKAVGRGRILAIIQGMAICDLAIAATVLDRTAARRVAG